MTAASDAFKEIVPRCSGQASPVVTTVERFYARTAAGCGSSNEILHMEFLRTSSFASASSRGFEPHRPPNDSTLASKIAKDASAGGTYLVRSSGRKTKIAGF